MTPLEPYQAEQLAEMLIQSFQHASDAAPQTRSVLKQQLTTILKTKDAEVASGVTHPVHGLPGKSKFLSAYELNQWFENRAGPVVHRLEFSEDYDLEEPKNPLEAKRRHIIAAAHKVSLEERVKLSDVLRRAVDSFDEDDDPELKEMLEAAVKRFDHLPAPKYSTKETRIGK